MTDETKQEQPEQPEKQRYEVKKEQTYHAKVTGSASGSMGLFGGPRVPGVLVKDTDEMRAEELYDQRNDIEFDFNSQKHEDAINALMEEISLMPEEREDG